MKKIKFNLLLILIFSTFLLTSCGNTTTTNTKLKGPYQIASAAICDNSPWEIIVFDGSKAEANNSVYGHISHNGAQQKWELVYLDDKLFKIKIAGNNKNTICLNDNKTTTILVPDNETGNNLWFMEKITNTNDFILIHKQTGNILRANSNASAHTYELKVIPYTQKDTYCHFRLLPDPQAIEI